MRNWKEHRFGELVHFPPRVVLRKGEEYPFIDMDVVNPSNRYVEYTQRRKCESSSCAKFASGDVLLARITPCLENGKIAQVRTINNESGFGSTEFFVFRAKDKLLDQSFLFYLAKSNLIWKSAVNSMVGASGRQRADATFLKKVKLLIPDPPVQRKIAAILSAYDELIENNQRRIALLEKMAEEIYCEWFVRLRFPGHEKVKVIKGVPEGWGDQKFGQFCQLQRGYDLTDADVEPGPYPVIASTSIKTYHSQYKVEPPVITTGRSGSLGEVLFVNTRAWPHNTALYVKHFFGNSAFLVYYTLKNMGLEHFNAGAGVPTLNRNHLNRIPIIVPNKEIQNRFDGVILKLHKQAELLRNANQKLTMTRDALLPRLISGKISVEKLDIQFPPSMADELKA